jgi:hypothetical protein
MRWGAVLVMALALLSLSLPFVSVVLVSVRKVCAELSINLSRRDLFVCSCAPNHHLPKASFAANAADCAKALAGRWVFAPLHHVKSLRLTKLVLR